MPKKRAGGADGAAAKKSRTDEIPRMTKVRKARTLSAPECLPSEECAPWLCHSGSFAVLVAAGRVFLSDPLIVPCCGQA